MKTYVCCTAGRNINLPQNQFLCNTRYCYIVNTDMYLNNTQGIHCCISIAPMVLQTCYNVELQLHCLSCYLSSWSSVGVQLLSSLQILQATFHTPLKIKHYVFKINEKELLVSFQFSSLFNVCFILSQMSYTPCTINIKAQSYSSITVHISSPKKWMSFKYNVYCQLKYRWFNFDPHWSNTTPNPQLQKWFTKLKNSNMGWNIYHTVHRGM